jgi:Mg/Co/Ni transporter MgtE
MPALETVTTSNIRRTMLRALATAVLVAAILAMAGLSFEMSHFISDKALWYAVIAPELLAIGFIPVWAAQSAKRSKIKRTQRIAAYKASPASHILHLND